MVDELRPPPPDDLNPYAAPRAAIGATASDFGLGDYEAESIRRAHLIHETNIKALGSLAILGGIFLTIVTLGAVVNRIWFGLPAARRPIPIGTMIFYGLYGLFGIALGVGLRRLQPWARWTLVVLMVFNLISTIAGLTIAFAHNANLATAGPLGCATAFVLAFNGFILYLLLAPKATLIFSPQYKEILAKTPHIRYRTSLWIKIAVAVFIVLIGF
jgi:hypothetical protein